jgi:hypothetical protein
MGKVMNGGYDRFSDYWMIKETELLERLREMRRRVCAIGKKSIILKFRGVPTDKQGPILQNLFLGNL